MHMKISFDTFSFFYDRGKRINFKTEYVELGRKESFPRIITFICQASSAGVMVEKVGEYTNSTVGAGRFNSANGRQWAAKMGGGTGPILQARFRAI